MQKINFQLFSWPPIASHLCFLLLGLFASSEYWKSKKQMKSLNPLYEDVNEIILKLPRKYLRQDSSTEFSSDELRDLVFVLNSKAGKTRCFFKEIRTSQWGILGKDKIWLGFSKDKLRHIPSLLSRMFSKSSSDWSLVAFKKSDSLNEMSEGSHLKACPRMIL